MQEANFKRLNTVYSERLKTMETVKGSVVPGVVGKEGLIEHRGFLGCETTLYDTIMVGWVHILICLSKLMECITLRVSPNVNYTPWVMMMYQWRFINVVNITTTGEDFDNCGKLCIYRGRSYMGNLCTFCSILL